MPPICGSRGQLGMDALGQRQKLLRTQFARRFGELTVCGMCFEPTPLTVTKHQVPVCPEDAQGIYMRSFIR